MALRSANLRITESPGIVVLRLLVWGNMPFSLHSQARHGEPGEEVRELGSLAVTLPKKANRKTLAWRWEKWANTPRGA